MVLFLKRPKISRLVFKDEPRNPEEEKHRIRRYIMEDLDMRHSVLQYFIRDLLLLKAMIHFHLHLFNYNYSKESLQNKNIYPSGLYVSYKSKLNESYSASTLQFIEIDQGRTSNLNEEFISPIIKVFKSFLAVHIIY